MTKRAGVPLHSSADGIIPVARWWGVQLPGGSYLRLRTDFVVPFHASWMSDDDRRTPMKDLVNRRGVAARLYLVALLEEQNKHRGTPLFEAGPIVERSKWRDRTDDSGVLHSPSWASLTLGYSERPGTPKRQIPWRRSRIEAVTNGFQRLADLELFDYTESLILRDDRLWRRRPDVAQRAYKSPTSRQRRFRVPASMFTSGLYLRLSGAALHSTLVALQHQQTPVNQSPFSRHGLTSQAFDAASSEFSRFHIPKDIAGALEHLRAVRLDRKFAVS